MRALGGAVHWLSLSPKRFHQAWALTVVCLALLTSCSKDQPRSLQVPRVVTAEHEVTIHNSPRLGAVDLSLTGDGSGSVACKTCHSVKKTTDLPKTMTELQAFHQGLSFTHGTLPCGSCHLSGSVAELHLADGTRLPVKDAIRLCEQCHGPQTRDYRRGSHGGMNGYWDLKRGGRVRNHCVDCHNPHEPQIKPVIPAPPPRDRFFSVGATPSRAEMQYHKEASR